jgi:CSLREA domain-containing protein
MTIRSFHRAQARRLDRATRRANVLARRGRLLAGATLGATALLASSAQAATYTVTTTADSNDGSCAVALCSLRDAINAANSDGTADTITFASGVTGQINLTGALPITTDKGLTITGPGASSLTVSGQGNSQIFDITSSGGGGPGVGPANAISGLKLTDGSTSDAGGAVSDLSFEPLVLTHDVISNSKSTSSGSESGGGGVFAEGPLEIVSSTISGNTAAHGGGVEANPKYNSVTTEKYGLSLVIKDSTITNNHATSASSSGPTDFGGGGGVTLYGPQMVMQNSTVSGNTSVESGGGIDAISKYGMTISGSKLNRNTATYSGGAIMDEGFVVGRKYAPTEISTSTISGNHAHSGGGLAFAQYGENPYRNDASPQGQPITIADSTISGNRGADKAPHASSKHSFGGGIEVLGSIGSPFRLSDSTVSGNVADEGGGIGLGGAYDVPLISTDPTTGQSGSISLDNSTITGNEAKLATEGGGIYLGAYHTSKSSPEVSGTAAIESTIVSGNTALGKPNDLRRAQASTKGGFTGDYSLIQHPGAAPLTGTHLITGKSADLGPLQNNGGPTETKLPAPKSPVIDQGHAELGVTTDQRGHPRTVDTAVPNPPGGDGTDIGAVELSSGQVKTAPDPGFSADVGKQRLGAASTPLLIDGVTPTSCRVTIGPLGSCQLEVTVDGHLVAAGGRSAAGTTQRLSATADSSKVGQRYLLRHYPLGLVASARASGLAVGAASSAGTVRLLGGPSITLDLGTASTRFSKKVTGELDQAARLLAGMPKVTVTAASSSQAKAVAKRLSQHGVKATVRVSRHTPARQVTISFS